MLEIIKYQLKGRKNNMLLIGAIFALVNLMGFGVVAKQLIVRSFLITPGAAFWVPIAVIVTVLTTIVMFFKCSSGHVDQLLYKDTNYLMLTIPRHGWEVLGGRFLAGLIEFLTYLVCCAVLLTIHGAFGAAISSQGQRSFFESLAFVYKQLFALNLVALIQFLLIALCIFTTLGFFLTFATVASRSFVKNKGIATAITIAVFITVCNWAIKLGTSLSEGLGWFSKIKVTVDQDFLAWGQFQYANMPSVMEISVPVAPFLFFILFAAVLFGGASWLMEKKVEL